NPNEQLHLHDGIFYCEQNESDERNAGHAVGFKSVRGRSYRISRIIPRAIGDDAGITRVVFFDFEDDFHEVGADVRYLREDAAGNAQGGGAERFANGESDEARAGVIAWNEK